MDGEPEASPIQLTASPVPTVTPTTDVSPDPDGDLRPEPTPTPPEERDPTDADRARFIASYRPSGVSSKREVAADIDGDGIREVVFTFVVDAERRSRVDIAAWTGTSYEIVERSAGGPADRIESVRITDLTDDDRTEIAVIQRTGAAGHSASIWQVLPGGTLRPLVAVGDCFAGSHTYGDTGVELRDRTGDGLVEIAAVCEDPETPEPLWPTVVYAWDGESYGCDHRITADGVRTDCH